MRAPTSVSRETTARLQHFVDLVLVANETQNLIATGSAANIWQRHVEDSAQLLRFRDRPGRWLDIGSGAGFPGMVLAILGGDEITLAEPRRRRAEFLEHARVELGLDHVVVAQAKAAAMSGQYDYITARAVASLGDLLTMTRHLTHRGTIFILPKGRSAQSELAAARNAWQGEFRLEQSLTSDDASIIVATNVRQRGK